MMVWTYPEKQRVEFGATRWQVEWWTLKSGVVDGEDCDFDRDLETRVKSFQTKAAAMEYAAKAAKLSYFGTASVEEQRVDWFVEEDRIAEWVGVGKVEEISA